MSFMQPEVYRGDFYEVETSNGTEILPCDAIGTFATIGAMSDYLEGTYQGSDDDEPEIKRGWLYRMQAPGYLDATGWSVARTERDAHDELLQRFGTDEPDAEREDWKEDSEAIVNRK